jgi:hypothetical protein
VAITLALRAVTAGLTDTLVYRLLKDFSLPLLAIIWAIYSYLRQHRRKLSIRQVGDEFKDSIAYSEQARTSYSIEVATTNDSPQTPIVIAWYSIELPWNEPDLEPVPDPKDTNDPKEFYIAPGKGVILHRDNVLNHRRYQNGRLGPGEAFRGFFLATGESSISSDLMSRERPFIKANFVVQDTTGREYKSPIFLRYWPAVSP